MRLLHKLLFAVFLLPLFSYGQTGYYPGYAVTVKNDTLKGYIKYVQKENNPRVIQFKSEANSKPMKLTVNDITYFNIDAGFLLEFQRYQGPITMDKTNIDQMQTARDTSIKVDTVFLKVLQKGKNIVLYSYDDNLKTRYFIGNSLDYKPVELTYRLYYNDKGSGAVGGRTVYENTYKKQLFALGVKYGAMGPALQSDIEQSAYSESNLLTITSKINGLSVNDTSKNNHQRPKLLKLSVALALFTVIAFGVLKVRH